MGITVLSPHDGQPVKIRDQDVGRAVRDGEGRIFYALPKSDGSGYYGARTRAGGERDEQRALELESKVQTQGDHARDQVKSQLHDARGKKRGGGKGKLLLLLIIIAALVAAYLFTFGPFGTMTPPWESQGSPSGILPAEPPRSLAWTCGDSAPVVSYDFCVVLIR